MTPFQCFFAVDTVNSVKAQFTKDQQTAARSTEILSHQAPDEIPHVIFIACFSLLLHVHTAQSIPSNACYN